MDAAPDMSVYKVALIVLGAAGVVIPLFLRLQVSPVLGFMLVGMAVGPFGFGALTRFGLVVGGDHRRSARDPAGGAISA